MTTRNVNERMSAHDDISRIPGGGNWIEGEGTAVFVPEGYESRYAYPVVVWLEGSDHSQAAGARSWFPRASDRNCIVISLEPPLVGSAGSSPEWRSSPDDLWEVLDYVGTAVAEVSAEMNVHPDRVFLAGNGDGGSVACDLLCVDPDQFAGAIAVAPSGPQADGVLHDWRSIPSRSVLVLDCDAHSEWLRQLRQSGIDVDWEPDLPPRRMASRMIDWIMSHIPTTTPTV